MSLLQEFKDWIWPTFRPQEYNYFITKEQEPVKRKQSGPIELHTEFAGYNAAGNVLKSTPLQFQDDKSTTFSTVKTFVKGKGTEANVVSHLTEHDLKEIARRKPLVSEKAAVILKANFAERNGVITASELVLITGYSLPYCESALASFRAALLSERGANP